MGSVVGPHARALAFISFGIPTGWRTLFLFTIWLNNIDPTKRLQGLLYESIEPSLRKFPMFRGRNPFRVRSASALQPSSVGRGIWKAHEQGLSRTTPEQDGDCCLIPDPPQPLLFRLYHRLIRATRPASE